MITAQADGLRELGTRIFHAQGAPKKKASFVAETLVEGNLTGHDSHGVQYFVTYSDRIREGFIDVKADPRIDKETPTTALVDGQWAFGQVTAMRAMETAVAKARRSMVAAVGAYNCNHIGRLGYYNTWAASQGVIGMMFVNVGNPNVTGYNIQGRAFGTNPVSVSTPTGRETPFLMDYATSIVAHGKVSVARAKHEKIPTGWVRDKYGRVTDDPNVMWDGGWLLPFGEYKGYGLQMVSELLGAALTGSRLGLEESRRPPSPNGVFIVAVNPEAFVGLDAFEERAGRLVSWVKGFQPEAGKTVLVPGEPEAISKEKRLREGIPIPEDTWAAIVKLCGELGIDPGIALKK
jgi:LDH2 family malate/lactate/ureidoglycolate dehydrogenase